MSPLVSVIGISYNHAPYIEEALNSLFAQTYSNVQIILMDDASTDGSPEILKNIAEGKEVEMILHPENCGYTKTFNEGLALAKGEYIIDFALDDVMEPGFIETSVRAFKQNAAGVVFSNALYIDEESQPLANHTEQLIQKGMIKAVPQGDVFASVLKRYFICTPTMVIRREVFDRLGGYDDQLAYEDFDFWVRSSRIWEYNYVDQVLLKKRKLNNSMSANRYQHHYNEQMNSVYLVCLKAFHLCKTREEFQALIERVNYEYRQCVKHNAEHLVSRYVALLEMLNSNLSLKSRLFRWYQRKFRLVR